MQIGYVAAHRRLQRILRARTPTVFVTALQETTVCPEVEVHTGLATALRCFPAAAIRIAAFVVNLRFNSPLVRLQDSPSRRRRSRVCFRGTIACASVRMLSSVRWSPPAANSSVASLIPLAGWNRRHLVVYQCRTGFIKGDLRGIRPSCSSAAPPLITALRRTAAASLEVMAAGVEITRARNGQP